MIVPMKNEPTPPGVPPAPRAGVAESGIVRRAGFYHPGTLRFRADDEVFEVTRAVGLRPEPHLAGDRRLQHRVVGGEEIRVRRRATAAGAGLGPERVLEGELVVDPRLEV